MLEDNKYFI